MGYYSQMINLDGVQSFAEGVTENVISTQQIQKDASKYFMRIS